MWSFTLVAPPGSLPDFRLLSLFGFGAILLRGAGFTINDLLDRDIDTLVERTKSRPIASRILTPFQGLCFLGSQLLLGLGILLQLNNYRMCPSQESSKAMRRITGNREKVMTARSRIAKVIVERGCSKES